MDGVVLAGGLGTRLRPLTNTRPKPILPILNRPMLEWVIRGLPREVDRVILAVSYRKEAVEEYFRDHPIGRDLLIVDEGQPLGTGGALKNLEGKISERFLVFNGDVVHSLDPEAMLEHHRRRGGIGTISTWRVDDVSRFGVLDIGRDGRIRRFVEKPPPGEAPSNWINAGTYVLEPEVFDLMEPGRPVSIEREVFPRLTEKGLHAFRFRGYWIDAGKPDTFLEATRLLLRRARPSRAVGKGTVKEPSARVAAFTLIGPGCRIGSGAAIGRYTCLGAGVTVGEGTTVSGSVLMDGTAVGRNCRIEASILGRNCVVGDGAVVEGHVAGDGDVLKGVLRGASR